MIPAPGTRGPANAGLEVRGARAVSGAAGSGNEQRTARGDLPVGQVVRVTVLKSLGPDSWSVMVNGKTMSARSSMLLVPGQVLDTRVEAGGETLFLRLTPQSSIIDFLQNNRLPTDTVMLAVVEALMRSGLPLDVAVMRRFRSILLRSSDQNTLTRRARLLAIAARKGLSPDEKGLESLDSLSRNDGPGDGRAGRDRRGKRESDTKDDREPIRYAVGRSGEEAQHPLQLFNHRREPGREHWVVIPVVSRVGDAEYHSSLRLLLSMDLRTVLRGSLIAECSSGCWGFEWEMDDGRMVHLRVHPPAEGIPVGGIKQSADFRRLCAVLREYGVDAVDIEESDPGFDGFSSELPMDIMRSVQEEA